MSSRSRYLFVFFFQAEDGIRDRDVTGVQTCALPISGARSRNIEDFWLRRALRNQQVAGSSPAAGSSPQRYLPRASPPEPPRRLRIRLQLVAAARRSTASRLAPGTRWP